jgi:hypothetical protein
VIKYNIINLCVLIAIFQAGSRVLLLTVFTWIKEDMSKRRKGSLIKGETKLPAVISEESLIFVIFIHILSGVF